MIFADDKRKAVLIRGLETRGGGGGTQIWFRRGCAAEAPKPVPIFKGHFGGRVPIIKGLAEKGTHY